MVQNPRRLARGHNARSAPSLQGIRKPDIVVQVGNGRIGDAGQVGVGQVSVSQVGAGQIGVVQIGVVQTRSIRPSAAGRPFLKTI